MRLGPPAGLREFPATRLVSKPGRALALLLALALQGLAPGADAGERTVLGWSHAIVNDSIGQFRDRWQSSAVQGSLFLGPEGRDPRSFRPGDVIELRLSHYIMTPESLDAPSPTDRLFAGALAAEVLTHGALGPGDLSLGAGIVAVGPQTGTFRAQRWLHEILGYPLPRTEGREVEDAFHPVLSAEYGREWGAAPRIRPFVEARAGVETIARVGVDVTLGAFGRDSLMIREPVTGQRLEGIGGTRDVGVSFTAGADLAHVGRSVYLPEDRGYDARPRLRLRAGVHWRSERVSFSYGLTYLGEEFEGQPEGQLLGSVQLRVRF